MSEDYSYKYRDYDLEKDYKEEEDEREEEDEKFDLNNLLSFLSSKNLKVSHLFTCDNKVIFLLVETTYSYLLVYIPSKFSVVLNSKSISSYIPTTNIKQDDDNDYKFNKKSLSIKTSFEKSLKMFLSNPIKMAFIYRDVLIFMNRHNEIEHLTFETFVPFENIYWIVDLENFYSKVNNIDLELNNITNNVMLSLYSNFESRKKDAIHLLNKKLQLLNGTTKTIIPYKDIELRTKSIVNRIDRENNLKKKEDYLNQYRVQMNQIHNNYIQQLIKWNSYFTSLIDDDE